MVFVLGTLDCTIRFVDILLQINIGLHVAIIGGKSEICPNSSCLGPLAVILHGQVWSQNYLCSDAVDKLKRSSKRSRLSISKYLLHVIFWDYKVKLWRNKLQTVRTISLRNKFTFCSPPTLLLIVYITEQLQIWRHIFQNRWGWEPRIVVLYAFH